MRCQCAYSPLSFLHRGLRVLPILQTTHHTPLKENVRSGAWFQPKWSIPSAFRSFKASLLDGSLVRETRCIVGARCFILDFLDSWIRIVNIGSSEMTVSYQPWKQSCWKIGLILKKKLGRDKSISIRLGYKCVERNFFWGVEFLF